MRVKYTIQYNTMQYNTVNLHNNDIQLNNWVLDLSRMSQPAQRTLRELERERKREGNSIFKIWA